jgi:hypothetical protein
VFASLDHPLHLIQIGFVFLLLLPVSRRLFFIESVDVSGPASFNVRDANVVQRWVVCRYISSGYFKTVLFVKLLVEMIKNLPPTHLNPSVNWRHNFVLLLVVCLRVRHRKHQLIKVLKLWQIAFVASHHITIN